MKFSIFFPISFVSIQNLKKKIRLNGFFMASPLEKLGISCFVCKKKWNIFLFFQYSVKIHYRAELKFQNCTELHFSMKIFSIRKGIFQTNSIHFNNIVGISIKLFEAKTTSDGKTCNLNMTHNESWSRQNIVRYST